MALTDNATHGVHHIGEVDGLLQGFARAKLLCSVQKFATKGAGDGNNWYVRQLLSEISYCFQAFVLWHYQIGDQEINGLATTDGHGLGTIRGEGNIVSGLPKPNTQ